MENLYIFYPNTIERIVNYILKIVGLTLIVLGIVIKCFNSIDTSIIFIFGICFISFTFFLSDNVAILFGKDDIVVIVPQKHKIKHFKWIDFSYACYAYDYKGRKCIILSDNEIDLKDKKIKHWINSGNPLSENKVCIACEMSYKKEDVKKMHDIIKERFPNINSTHVL